MENETDELTPRIDGDGKVTLSFAPHEWFGIILTLIAIVAYVLRIETAVHVHDSFMEEQKKLNQEVTQRLDANDRSHEVIARNVNETKWRVKRVERRLGIRPPEMPEQ